jgi:3-oxoacyl-[acyl-carrier-protein] synthase-3
LSESLRPVYLAGTGHHLPARILTNADLFEMPSVRAAFDVDMARGALRGMEPDEVASLGEAEVFDRWAIQLTGIAERRVLPDTPDASTEAMHVLAGEAALEHAAIDRGEIDLLLAASLTAREDVPNAACTIAAGLDRPDLPGYVMNSACSGFLHALASAYAFIASGASDTVLVTVGDALTRITNWHDPKVSVLFGDGAGAAVLTARPSAGRLLAPPVLAGEYSPDHLNITGLGWGDPLGPEHRLSMAGGANVLRHAIRTMEDVADRALARTPHGWDDVDVVVPHQANERITRGLEKSLQLSKGRVLHRIRKLGNLSASTVPIVLDELLRGEHGALQDPTRIVLTAVGGGYASGAAVLEWTPPTG